MLYLKALFTSKLKNGENNFILTQLKQNMKICYHQNRSSLMINTIQHLERLTSRDHSSNTLICAPAITVHAYLHI